ncbi:uncharacterized protein LOC126803741 [Argentina anserina]|uniref:uncharacterized protein LOC126803741 n=1 Tax=Argentina anserina TaxID=57926 RepID=UPI0021762A39|nr:uncharacterized protein LOC126803741 [Potentilla anserina]
MRIVSSVSFSILINGKFGGNVVPTRGLRQGDPLSPFLFLLVGEVLSRNIVSAVRDHKLQHIKLNRNCPGLSHLMFVDDTLCFTKANVEDYRKLRLITDSYCSASGQRINFDKSSVFFSSNTPVEIHEAIANELGIPVSQPGVYLGLPTMWGNSKRSALAYIRERVKRKLDGWKANILSQAGREVLIKFIAMVVPTYPMSIFLLPKLLSKQGRRLIHNDDSMWARILRARYFDQSSFLKAKKGSRPSWIWNSLLAGRDSVSKQFFWQVHNGRSIDVWSDSWVPNNNGGEIIPVDTSNRFTPLQVHDLIDESRNWDVSHLQYFLSEEDFSSIKAIPIGDVDERDILVWPHSKDGDYSMKSGYKWIFNPAVPKSAMKPSSSHVISPNVWHVVWKADFLPKISNFLWRALSNALSTGWNVFKGKIIPSPTCALCGEHVETIEHCLLLCPWTELVWFGNSLGSSQKLDLALQEWLDVFALVCFHLWEIWKEKCSAVSKKILPNPSTIYNIQRSFHEWFEAKESIKKALDLDDDSGSNEAIRRSEESHVRGRAGLRNEERKNWSPPPRGLLKSMWMQLGKKEVSIVGLVLLLVISKGSLWLELAFLAGTTRLGG